MGTNYYLKTEPDKVCAHCGHAKEGELLHIGKSSGGWCFSLHVYPDTRINDLDDWLPLLERGQIEDEYGDRVSVLRMLSIIRDREAPPDWDDPGRTIGPWSRYNRERDDHLANGSVRGPKGLLRHPLDESCVSHGAGTWDCIDADFC